MPEKHDPRRLSAGVSFSPSPHNDTPGGSPKPLSQQFSVVPIDVPAPTPVGADGAVFERRIRVRPLFIHERIAVNEPRDVLKQPILPPQIDGNERIAVAHSLDRPAAGAATNSTLAIDVRHRFKKPEAALNFWKLIHHQFDGEWVRPKIGASAQHLDHMALIAQQKVLRAIHRLQKRAPTPQVAQRDDAAETGVATGANISPQNACEVFRSPENLGLKAAFRRINEKYKGPRPRRA